ncbi:ABC transporter substrate-binding protein [Arthrobacter sp. 2MCAF15]|uniref:ABC transporter substrate-binding protein n=1 Tax=Arthrobacter sp. 2MCAF15 TaxID=3232984 RepID=UPI003F8E8E1B
MKTSRIRIAGMMSGLLAGTIVLAGCGAETNASPASSGAGPVNANITIGMGPQLSNADVTLGMSNNTFKNAGLTVTTQAITVGSAAVPLLLNGQMQFAQVDMATALSAAHQDVGVVIVAPNTVGNGDEVGYAGIVTNQPGIKSAKDLEGKKVQVNQLKGTAQILLETTMESEGADPSKVQFVEIAPPQAIPALQSGQVDAAFLSEPLVQTAKKLGMTVVLNPEQKTVAGIPTFVFLASAEYADANPAVIKAFSDSILESNKFANANPDAVRKSPAAAKVDPALLPKMTLPKFAEFPVATDHVQKFIDLEVKHGVFSKDEAPKAESLIIAGK